MGFPLTNDEKNAFENVRAPSAYLHKLTIPNYVTDFADTTKSLI